MSGYVRIHRTLIGHPVFRNDAEAMVFAWLITQAQWKRTRVRYRDHIIQLERGQLAISLRDLAFRFDRDKAWVSRLLKRLQSEAMIETRTETGVSVITLCNYNEYQADAVLCETPRETQGETGARQGRDTEQEREEGKKEEPPVAPRKRGASPAVSFPSDWVMPKVATLTPKARACAEQWTRASYETVHEAFVLHWRNSRKRRPDWLGTWCVWIIREHSKVMRDQKFGNAPTDKAQKCDLSAQQLRERAEWFVRHGQPDNAEDCRRKAIALEQRQAA